MYHGVADSQEHNTTSKAMPLRTDYTSPDRWLAGTSSIPPMPWRHFQVDTWISSSASKKYYMSHLKMKKNCLQLSYNCTFLKSVDLIENFTISVKEISYSIHTDSLWAPAGPCTLSFVLWCNDEQQLWTYIAIYHTTMGLCFRWY